MIQHRCINLCDHEWEEILKLPLVNKERIYLGSYFCCRFLLHYDENKWHPYISKCTELGIKITLVVPIVIQRYVTPMRELISKLLHQGEYCIDEITVNDYGTLNWVKDTSNLSVNLGRLFFKEYRDPRFHEYFESTYKPHIFTPYFQTIVNTFHVLGLELDPICQKIDLSEAFDGLLYALHEPSRGPILIFLVSTFSSVCI